MYIKRRWLGLCAALCLLIPGFASWAAGTAEEDTDLSYKTGTGETYASIVEDLGLSCQAWELRNWNDGKNRTLRTGVEVEIPQFCFEVTPPTTQPPVTTVPPTTAPPTTVPPTTVPPTTVPPTTAPPTTTPPTTAPPTTVPPVPSDWVPFIDEIDESSNELLRESGGGFGSNQGTPGEVRWVCYASHVDTDNPLQGWDPIVAPGGFSAHSHTFFGNAGTNPDSTYESLRAEPKGSTCAGGNVNKSAYWFPTVYDREGNVVEMDFAFVYYKTGYWGQDGADVQPVPPGLKMISYSHPGYNSDYWGCVGGFGEVIPDQGDTIPNCGNRQVAFSILFPQCWDGVNLDSPDHKSHMAHPNFQGQCPDSHPVLLPQITMNVGMEVSGNGNYGQGWTTSADIRHGTQGGQMLHADFFDAWTPGFMGDLVGNCLNQSKNCNVWNLGDGFHYPAPAELAGNGF